MKELAKQYDPSQVEDRIYQFWQDGGYFHTEADPDKKPYTIVIPPPNVTGQLLCVRMGRVGKEDLHGSFLDNLSGVHNDDAGLR